MMRKSEEAPFWKFWELPVVGVEEEVVERSKLGQRYARYWAIWM